MHILGGCVPEKKVVQGEPGDLWFRLLLASRIQKKVLPTGTVSKATMSVWSKLELGHIMVQWNHAFSSLGLSISDFT